MSSLAKTWGTTAGERQLAFPCDEIVSHPDASLHRGVTIDASADTIFRWLCQMRVAPYSYDLIDNGGRQSPKELVPGLDQLAVGQDVMTIFELVAFARNKHLTIRMKPTSRSCKIFGELAASYLIIPNIARACRLLVKLVVRYPPGARGTLMSWFLPWGDLIMMRRQLLNFKRLAESMSQIKESTREPRSSAKQH